MCFVFAKFPRESLKMENCRFFPHCHNGDACKRLHVDFKNYPCVFTLEGRVCSFRQQCLFSHSVLEKANHNMDQRLLLIKDGYTLAVTFQVTSETISLARLKSLDDRHLTKSVAALVFYFKNYEEKLASVFDYYLRNIWELLKVYNPYKWGNGNSSVINLDSFETIVVPILGMLMTDSFIDKMPMPVKNKVFTLLNDSFKLFKFEYYDTMSSIVESGLSEFWNMNNTTRIYYPVVLSELFYPIFKALFVVYESHPKDEWNYVFKNYVVLFKKAESKGMFLAIEKTITDTINNNINKHASILNLPPVATTVYPVKQAQKHLHGYNSKAMVLAKTPVKTIKVVQKHCERMNGNIKKSTPIVAKGYNANKCYDQFTRIKGMIDAADLGIKDEFKNLLKRENENLSNADNTLFKKYKYLELSAEKYLHDVEKAKKIFMDDYTKYIAKK